MKKQAEEEGLARIFIDAGFDWREAGCSMCLGMNEDQLKVIIYFKRVTTIYCGIAF